MGCEPADSQPRSTPHSKNATRIQVPQRRLQFNYSARLLGTIEFYHEALHIEGLHNGGQGCGSQV